MRETCLSQGRTKYQCCGPFLCFLADEFGIRDEKKFGSGIRDEHPGSYFRELINSFFWVRILNSLTSNRYGYLFGPGSWMNKFGSRIRYKHPGSVTLVGDPDAGSSAVLTLGWRMGKTPDPRSGIQDKHTGSYFRKLGNNFGQKILQFLVCGNFWTVF